MALSRFLTFREATDVLTGRRKKKAPATQPRVGDIVDDINQGIDDVETVANQIGVTPDTLALQIDHNLGEQIWSGTTIGDRITHTATQFSRDILADVERSLIAQERYEDFEARMFKSLGLDSNPDQPTGALKNLDFAIRQDVKLAWNEAMAATNQGDDAIPVWRAVLDEATTPGCAASHGLRVEQDLDGVTPPRHFQCRCDTVYIGNPDSTDPDIAEQGQQILDEMVAEREAWGASGSPFAESRPSRFLAFREATLRHP